MGRIFRQNAISRIVSSCTCVQHPSTLRRASEVVLRCWRRRQERRPLCSSTAHDNLGKKRNEGAPKLFVLTSFAFPDPSVPPSSSFLAVFNSLMQTLLSYFLCQCGRASLRLLYHSPLSFPLFLTSRQLAVFVHGILLPLNSLPTLRRSSYTSLLLFHLPLLLILKQQSSRRQLFRRTTSSSRVFSFLLEILSSSSTGALTFARVDFGSSSALSCLGRSMGVN
jgi:hypothetical protein